jgi:hypothetical protein
MEIQPSDCGLAIWRRGSAEAVIITEDAMTVTADYEPFIPPAEDEPIIVQMHPDTWKALDTPIVPEYDLDDMTRNQMKDFAKAQGIDIRGLTAKRDIRAAIEAWEGQNGI